MSSSFLMSAGLTLPQPQSQFHQNGLQSIQQHLPNYNRPDYRQASNSPPTNTNNPASPLTFNVSTANQPQTTSPALKRKQIDQPSVLGLKRRRETNPGAASTAPNTASGNPGGSASAGGVGNPSGGGGGDDADGYDGDGGNAGAKHWTDEEKSRLFNWLMGPGQEEHWNQLRATKNSCLRECASEVFGGRKTYQALKGCYERNFNLFKQIYAFESAHGQQATAAQLANLSEADRLREYERRLVLVRKSSDVGSITARTIDHWHRLGWYELFYRRWHGDPATTRPIQNQGGHSRNANASSSSNTNNHANANSGGGNTANTNNNNNDDGDVDDDGHNNSNNNAMDFQDSHSHSSSLGLQQQQQQQQQQHAPHGMGGHAGHGMHGGGPGGNNPHQHDRQQQSHQPQQHYINPQDLRDPSSSVQQQQPGRHQAPGLHAQQSSSHLTPQQQQQQQHHNPPQQGQNQGPQQNQQGQQPHQQQPPQHGMHSVMGLALNQQHLNSLHGSAGPGGAGNGGSAAEPLSNYLNAAMNSAVGLGSTMGGVGVVGVGMGAGPAMGAGVNPGPAPGPSVGTVGGLNPGGGAPSAGVGALGSAPAALGQGVAAGSTGTGPMITLTLPSDLATRWVYALTLQNQLAQEKMEYLKRKESRELKEIATRKEMEKTAQNRVRSEKAFELINNPNADPGLKQAATDYLRKMFLQD